MPLDSAHVFASHIGHTGKTTLSFNMSCLYATQNPDKKVLVMDLAEEGDLSKRLIGGVVQSERTREVFGGMFSLLGDAAKQTTLTSWLSSSMDLTRHAVQVSRYNQHVPKNVFLMSSGAYPTPDEKMELGLRKKISNKIRETLEKDPATWKLFCDTDGDRRPSPHTLIAYQLCEHAIVPLHLNQMDLDRTETMLAVMDDFRRKKEISTKVCLLVWNFVKVQDNDPTSHKGNNFPFTPQKVSLEMLDSCNKKVYDINRELSGLFVHSKVSGPAEFAKASTTILRQVADNVLKPSEEMGYPWCAMLDDLGSRTSQTFVSGDVKYSANRDVIEGSVENIKCIFGKLAQPTMGSPSATGQYMWVFMAFIAVIVAVVYSQLL